jgi:hypothetical protein
MKKVERIVVGAFVRGEECQLDNTRATKTALYLFGKPIASRNSTGQSIINHCGWETVTTRSRINALCHLLGEQCAISGVRISGGQMLVIQKDGETYPMGDQSIVVYRPRRIIYVQRRDLNGRETVDQFDGGQEGLEYSRAMLREYQLSDPSADYYLSSRACDHWREEATA